MALIEPKLPPASAAIAPEALQTEQPPASPAEPAPASPSQGGGLSDELIQVPAMQALLAGAPPAFSANIKQFAANPVSKLIVANKEPLMKAGMGFYQSLSGDLGVVFNQMYVHPEDIQAADKAGKLLQIAPPFDSVNSSVAQSGKENPALKVGSMPGGMAMPSIKAPPQSTGAPMAAQPAPQRSSGPGMAPASNAIQAQVMGLRAKNLTPGSPTSGPAPGAGRILNQILRPTV